jgi:hypothetical protein
MQANRKTIENLKLETQRNSRQKNYLIFENKRAIETNTAIKD